MKVLGLTGSIGMGKTTVAAMFAEEGVPVFDADAAVHALYAPGGAAVGAVGEAFPGCAVDGRVDRKALGAQVVGKPEVLKKLEAIVHPLVAKARGEFLDSARAAGHPLAVVDIPLLYEIGAENAVDEVIVVSAPAKIQRQRVLARPGMTAEKFEALLARQVPDEEKRRRADHVIGTGAGLDETRREVRQLIAQLSQGSG